MVLTTKEGEVERLMRDGQAAAKRGDKVMSRALLTQLLELDPHNEKAWMWLSGAVADPFEQQTCLENVLIINPQNAQARKGLEFIAGKTGSLSPVLLNVTGQVPASAPTDRDSASHGSSPDVSRGADPVPDYAAPAASAAQFNSFQLPDPASGNLPPWEDSNLAGPAVVAPAEAAWSTAPAPASDPMVFGATELLPSSAPEGPKPAELEAMNWNTAPEVEQALPDDFSFAGVAPFQPEADNYTGGPPRQGMPPDTGVAVPEWVRQDTQHEVTAALPPDGAQLGDASQGAAPDLGQVDNVESDLNAWLGQIGGGSQGAAPAPAPAHNEPNFALDPFAAPDLSSMDPFALSQLPSPGDLPGGSSAAGDQPWYLTASNSTIAPPPDHAYSSGQFEDGPESHEPMSSAAPVPVVDCPHCHTQVPETSLACPQCRFTFFVHCPYCHELIDTGDAKMGVSEPCPYCTVQINKMELGLINAGGLVPATVADPAEGKNAWMGTVGDEPKRGAVNLGWVVDLMWLTAIVLMVWALTQLPAWFNLTDLYS